MIKDTLKKAEQLMQNSLTNLESELAKTRTGRANPELLSQIKVSYYGNNTPLNQVANINVTDARTLTVVPWEKHIMKDIEKAIMNSDLGLNPNTTSESIRIHLPLLTKERRQELIKIVKQAAENIRVSIRNARRDANHVFKQLEKDKEISEDDVRHAEKESQQLTDKYIKKIDEVLSAKEKDLSSL
ncbi:MAG: ribosome recycling factor [Thiotrichales bacterium]|nr:MAG: ribosome recycling factor [Thiotrichales bacterium]